MDIEQFAFWSVGKLKADKRQCGWWFCYYYLGNGMVDTNGTARSQLTCTKNDNNWYGWTQSIWGSDLCNNFLVPLVHFISWFIKCLTLTTYKISYRWFVWFVTNLAFDLCNFPKSFADSWHSKRVGNFSAVYLEIGVNFCHTNSLSVSQTTFTLHKNFLTGRHVTDKE